MNHTQHRMAENLLRINQQTQSYNLFRNYLSRYWQRGLYSLDHHSRAFMQLESRPSLYHEILKNEFEFVFFFLDYTIAVIMPAYFVNQFFPRSLWATPSVFSYDSHKVIMRSSQLVFTRLPLNSFVINSTPLGDFFRLPFFTDPCYSSDTPVTQEDVDTDPEMPTLITDSDEVNDFT